jgi:uncharacterized protein
MPSAEPIPSLPPPRTDRYHPITPWTPFWGLGAVLLIGVIVFGFIALAGGLAVAIYPQAIETTKGALPKPRLDDPIVAYGFAALMLGSQLLGALATILFASNRGARPTDVLALRAPIGGALAYAWAIPLFVVFGLGVGLCAQWLWPQSNQSDTETMMQFARSPAAWLVFLVAVVGAPLQEELIFRGFLFSALARARWLGFIGAAIVSSICWAAIHGYSVPGDATIFCLGLMLTFILWRTGSTRVTMACHGTYNAVAFVLAAFAGGAGGS